MEVSAVGGSESARRRGVEMPETERRLRGESRRFWRLAGSALALALALAAPLTAGSEPGADEAQRASRIRPSVAREFSRRLLLPRRNGRGERARSVRALRGRLLELREALEALDREATPEGAAHLLERKQAAAGALTRLQRGGRGRRSQAAEGRLRALWREIDDIAADPIGQRGRLTEARGEVDAALEAPQNTKSLDVVVRSLPGPDAEEPE